ncbi:MAG: hypothetical protein ABIS84_14955 [Arachnia sp.]
MDDIKGRSAQPQPRWPWFAAGGLLLAAAAAAAISVHLLWLPCREIMWHGTVFASEQTGEIAEACSRRMDEGFPLMYFSEDVGLTPSASQVGGLAMVLAVASWIVVILGLRLGWRSTLLALIAAVTPAIIAVGTLAAALNPGADLDVYLQGWLWMSVDVGAVVVFVLLLGSEPGLEGRTVFGLAVVLWGATAFGGAHAITDYVIMIGINGYNWDTPPGTGWFTVAVIVIAGSAALWVGGRRREVPTVARPLAPSA